MSFDDYYFNRVHRGDKRWYPGHAEVLGYLEDFAKDHDLNKHI